MSQTPPPSIGPGVKEMFQDLAELAPHERAVELDARCGDKPELRAQVLALLNAHDHAGGFLVDPTIRSGRLRNTLSSTELLQRRIGPYRLVQVIGEGGFGTVYLAEQETPVRRRVALKLIKLGMDSRAVIARFDAERQALAMMDHPNIARVFDAGTTDDGRPYFVMELVSGVPVTSYCDANRLAIPRRSELFAQICAAVQHAHQKGVIHRDIKPTNVLVSTQDGSGGPGLAKVIDFGIAKATQDRLTEQTLFTEFHQLIGTPEYMSPEQAEGSLDIDTRTDIYSLGVLLYEMLTGTTPFSARDLRSKAFGEMQRMIRETDPPRPSTRLSSMRETIASIAAQRDIEPARLRSSLRGDLDWIVMKAMEKDRTRRYDSAGALGADVLRHLADEPVLAGPPGRLYRVSKFVRRHRGGVAAAATILLLLVSGLSVSLRLYVRESQALRRAVLAEADARRQRDAEAQARALSEQADEFVRGMFDAIDPAAARGKPVLVRDVLDQAVARIDDTLRDQPRIRGKMHRFFGNTYLKLGLADKAREQLELADVLLRQAAGEQDREFVMNLVDLGRCYQFLGKADAALALYRRAVDLGAGAFGSDDQGYVMIQSHLANVLMRQNKLDEASSLYSHILDVRMRTLGPAHEQTITTIGDVAWLRQLQGNFAESEQMLLEVLPAARKTLGDDHPRTLAFMNSLAQAQADNGKLNEAERTLDQVVAGAQRVYGPDHRNTLSAMGMHAKVLVRLGRLDEAESELIDSIQRLRSTLGEDHYNTLLNRLQLAQVWMAQNQLDDADREMVDVASRLTQTLGADHPEALTALSMRGQVSLRRKDLTEAERLLGDVLPRMKRVLGPMHPSTLTTAATFGQVLAQQNRWPEAEPILADAFTQATRHGLAQSQPVFAVGYGECLVELGKDAEAIVVLTQADDQLRRSPGFDPVLRKRLDAALARASRTTRP